LENVKGLLSKKHKEFFDYTLSSLRELGYIVNVDVYTSSEHGNPQKRQRVFYVGMLGNNTYNRIPKEVTKNIFDINLLEENVDQKYYLTEKAMNRLLRGGFRNDCTSGMCMTQTATQYKKNWQTPIIADFRYDEGIRPRNDKFSPTITTSNNIIVSFDKSKYRYLTPKECFRLMGFHNDEIKLMGLSETQQYKLAGNGWDINLVSKIFKEMFKEIKNDN
jgi:DNA (cytosine-5)-methyltransferase 1